jgi:hypothetical protein
MLPILAERIKRKKHHRNITEQKFVTMYKQQEINLIKDTQENLRDFDGEYTVDVLFNWMEIFFIPKSKWLKKLPTQKLDLDSWGIAPKDIRICKAYYKDGVSYRTVKDDRSVRNVARHIHNSVIHYWVLYYPLSGNTEMIKFMDWKNDRVNFELDVSVRNFRVFLLKFCETIIQGL